MKLLATGDSHLGKGQDLGRLPGDRLAEQEAVWAATLALARERRCDAVLHAGDLFDGRRPAPDVMLAAERPLVEHAEQGGCTVYVIAGNHDVPSQDGPCGLDVLAEAGLIELAREPRTWTVVSGGESVEVCALPWTPVSRLVAMNEDADRCDIHVLAADLLVETARGMWKPTLPTEPGQILLGHWSVSQTSLPSGLDVGSLGGVVLPMDELAGIGFGQIVFGHIHLYQCSSDFFYVGSPQPLDFGEANDDHGCLFLEWNQTLRLWESEFVPLASPGFITIDLDAAEVEQMTDGQMPPLAPALGRYVKIRYTATEEQARRVDLAALRAHADEYQPRRVWIEPTIERSHRDRGVALAEAQSPLQQLDAYLDAIGANGDKPAMLDRAERYLA